MSKRRLAWLAGILAGWLLSPAAAEAGGFEFPDHGVQALGRGGAFTARADDLSALWHNPAGLTKTRGWLNLLISDSLTWPFSRFERASAEGIVGVRDGITNYRFKPVEDEGGLFPLGAMLALSSDFGLEDWTFAIGVFPPNAVGGTRFNPGSTVQGSPDSPECPTAKMGDTIECPSENAARYTLIQKDITLLYINAAAAWRPLDNFSVGLNVIFMTMPKVDYRLMVDGAMSDQYLHPSNSEFDILARIDVADPFAISAMLGLDYAPADMVELGLAFQFLPTWIEAKGKIHLGYEGSTLISQFEPLTPQDVTLKFTLPMKLRFGARYAYPNIHNEIFDIELDVVWEMWSFLDAFRIDYTGAGDVKLLPKGSASGDQSIKTIALEDIRLTKNYRDTVSVRLGGDYRVIRPGPGDWFGLTLRLGGFYESPSVDTAYANLDVQGGHRFGVGGGLTARLWAFDVSLAYQHLFQTSRDVSDSRVVQQRPSIECEAGDTCPDVVVGNGRYSYALDTLTLGVQVHFDTFWGGRPRERTARAAAQGVTED